MALPSVAGAASTVGSFEIDGNRVDNSGAGEPIDWATPPPNLSTFTDGTGNKDDGFTNGSAEQLPGGWSCTTASAPQKGDILGGELAFRTIDGKQYAYLDFTRKASTGDVHIDYEFNQAGPPATATCPTLPKRTNGDIILAFDGNGGVLTPSAYRWMYNAGSTTEGTLIPLAVGSQGTTWDGFTSGTFGEAVLDLTSTIGALRCGQFSGAYMKSRSSESITSSLQDFTKTQPIAVGACPSSSVDKSVRNVTTSGAFGPTASASPGDTLEYQIVYKNSGAAPANNVIVTDSLDAKSTLVPGSCTPAAVACTAGTTNLQWNLGTVTNVAPGNTVTIKFSVTLTGPFGSGQTPVPNTASVFSTEETTPKTDTTTTTVAAAATFTVVKTADPTSTTPGGLVTYTIVVKNTGNTSGTHTFQDDFDDRIANRTTPSGCTAASGILTCTTGSLAPNATQTFTYTANMPSTFTTAPGGGSCSATNPVQQRVRNVILGTGGDDAEVCVNTPSSFTVDKTASPTTTTPGGLVTYTIVVKNTGASSGTHTFQDDFDDRITSRTTPAGCTVAAGVLTCTTGSLAPNATQTFTYTANMPTTFTSAPGGGGCSATDPVQQRVRNVIVGAGGDDAEVCVNTPPSFTVDKTANPTTVNAGGLVTYTIVVKNTGASPGTHTFQDDFDDRITNRTTPGGCTVAAGVLTCTTGSLAPNATQTFTYTANMPTTFTSAPGGGGCSATDPIQQRVRNVIVGAGGDDAEVCVNTPGTFTVDKTANPTSTTPGGLVTYTIVVTNGGASPGTHTFQDDFDDRITNRTTPGGCTVAGGILTCTTGTLNPGATQTFTYTANMPTTFTTAPGGGSCTATNPVQQQVRNVIVGAGGDDAEVCVNTPPSFTVDKTANPTSTTPGGLVTYTIVVKNTGASSGTHTFQDDFDDRIANRTTPSGCTAASGVLSCTTGSLAPNATQTFTYTANMPSTFTTAPGGGSCTATNPVQQRVRNVILGTGGDDAEVCVTTPPSFTVDKTANPTVAERGQLVTYTIVVRNTGASPGTHTFQDDFDDRITNRTTPAGCTVASGVLTCTTGILNPGATQTFTYTANMPTTFTTAPGGGTCTATQQRVRNVIVGGDDADVCVNAGPILEITKTACPSPSAVAGGILSYTITFRNTGQAAATNVTVTDSWPADSQVTVVSADGGTVSGNSVTWGPANIGTLDAGETNTRTLRVLVDAPNGATLQDTATISGDGATTATTGVVSVPVSNAGAITHGMAYGADADVLILNLINELGRLDTTATPAATPQVKTNTVLPLNVPLLVSLGIINTGSASAVTGSAAVTTSVASTAEVNLLGGLIKASAVKAVSQSTATPFGASGNSLGSTITGLTISGLGTIPAANLIPGAVFKVKDLLGLQTVAEVKILEETKSATLVNGKFTATHAVNGLRVTLLKSILGLAKGAEIIVSHAQSDATYPSGFACGAPIGTVSGKAFTANVDGTLLGTDFLDVEVANAEITPLGGNALSGELASIPGIVANATTTNTASGSLAPTPNATARSITQGVNVLSGLFAGGLVTADVLDVRSTSSTTATSASTTFQRTFANLRVAGIPISVDVSPNTVITVDLGPIGKAVVIIDERITAGNGITDTEGTINAIHVYVVGLSGLVTAEVIVASAHSDAHRA